eukprot:SAG22_NODE_7123_length_773_cov_1.179525_1_plen_215_part_01
MPYESFDPAPLRDEIVVQIGEGFNVHCGSAVCDLQIGQCESLSDCDAHASGVTPFAVAKLLLLVDGKPAPGLVIEGRRGPVVYSNPFVGGLYDHTAAGGGAWAALIPVPGAGEPGTTSTPAGVFRALALPPAVTAPKNAEAMRLLPTVIKAEPWKVDIAPAGVQQWLYTMSRNIVGAAIVSPEAYSGSGNLTLQYCEVMNGTRCLCLRRLCDVTD